jgi:hypothetical protein
MNSRSGEQAPSEKRKVPLRELVHLCDGGHAVTIDLDGGALEWS